jgi:magnesium transporter
MTRILRRRVIPGSPPGTLGAPAERRVETVTFRVMDYQADRLEEAAVAAVEELDGYLQRSDSVTWIDVVGLHDVALLSALGDKLCLHPLALEDVVNSHQRPKLEDYGEHSFVVLRLLRRQEGLASEQVSLFLGPGWVLTFQETPQDPFEPVRERLRRGRQRIRGSGSDYLAYALMDSLVDSFFPLLEHYGEQIEELEGELLARPERRSLERVHEIKKDLLEIRRATWPLREVINGFERQDISLVGEQTRLFLRDCYDHTIQLIDIVETYRDMAGALTDLYLSSLSHRMNEVMKILTVIASIFIPLTFLAGIYGMNFNPEASPWNMPELNWRWGYPVFWVAILALGGGLLWLFRRKDWL